MSFASVEDMAYNGRAPQDSASAQLAIVMGGVLTLGSVAGLVFVDAGLTTRRGFPVWILLVLTAAFGIFIVANGVRTHLKYKRGQLNQGSDPEGGVVPSRAARTIPLIYPVATAAVGIVGIGAGIVAVFFGLVAPDQNVVRIAVLVLGGGLVLTLIGVPTTLLLRGNTEPPDE